MDFMVLNTAKKDVIEWECGEGVAAISYGIYITL